MDNSMCKAKLLQTMRAARDEWEAVIARVGEERMMLPVLHGGWSVKDTIGHVAYYEQWLENWLAAAVRGKVTLATHRDALDVDERNALVWRANSRRTLAEILEESSQVFDRLFQLVKLLPESDLVAPYAYDRYVIPFWGKSQPLWKCIAGDSYEHYAEHTANIRSWLDEPQTRLDLAAKKFQATYAT